MKKIVAMIMVAAMVVTTAAVAFTEDADAATKNVSLSKAKAIALKSAGLKSSQVRFTDAERDGGIYEIEFIRKSNRAEYDFDVSLKGKVLKKSTEYKYRHNYSKKKIGKDKARAVVAKFSKNKLSLVKKGYCTFERDDGEGIYEVHFKKGIYRYEYDVLAPTGKVISWERVTIR